MSWRDKYKIQDVCVGYDDFNGQLKVKLNELFEEVMDKCYNES